MSGSKLGGTSLVGGRIVKWKGRVVSIAPLAFAIATGIGSTAQAACIDLPGVVAIATAGDTCVAVGGAYFDTFPAGEARDPGSVLTYISPTVETWSIETTLWADFGGRIVATGDMTAWSEGFGLGGGGTVLASNGSSMLFQGDLTADLFLFGTPASAVVEASGGSSIVVEGDATVTSQNMAGGHGIFANSGSVIGIGGHTTIASTGRGVTSAPTSTMPGGGTAGSSLVWLNSLDSTSVGNGLHAEGPFNNSIVVNGALDVETTGDSGHAAHAQNGGNVIVDPTASNGTGGADSLIVARHGDFTTGGDDAHGLYARVTTAAGSGSADIEIGPGATITTSGDNAEGAYAHVTAGTGAASITMDGGTVSTTGVDSEGLVSVVSTLLTGDASVEMNAGSISTGGDGSAGIVAQSNFVTSTGGSAQAVQNGGTISTTGGALGGAFQGAYGIVAVSSGDAMAEQNAGSITTSGAGSSGILTVSSFNSASVTQGAGGTITASGADADGISALAVGGITVDVAGTVTGGSGGGAAITTTTGAGALSTITLRSGADVGAASGVAVVNDPGDSTVLVESGASVAGQFLLGLGSDTLTFDGADISAVTLLDGGDDLSTADGAIDRLTFAGVTGALAGTNLTGWESVLVDGGALRFTDSALAVGAEPGFGLTLANGGAIELGTSFAITGNISNGGIIALGDGAAGDRLTIAGDYTGTGGTITLDTVLGGDSSATDRVTISGDATGSTGLLVSPAGGAGAETALGIQLVAVGGTSSADAFFLANGAPLERGAFVYALEFGNPADALDQSWYLRSTEVMGGNASIYESAPEVLMGFADLPTLEQRVGQRQWAGRDSATRGPLEPGRGAWLRLSGDRSDVKPDTSASSASFETTSWQLQAGLDALVREGENGVWVLGATAQFGRITGDVSNSVGTGRISGRGLGLGLTGTWYGDAGSYLDLQTQVTRIRADYEAGSFGTLADGTHATALALSAEVGHRYITGPNTALVPQAQLSWARLSGDAFTDSLGNSVDPGNNTSLTGRVGLAYEYEYSEGWLFGDRKAAGPQRHREKAYVIGNLLRDFSADSRVTLSGTELAADYGRTWAEIGVGGSIVWDGNKTLYTETAYRTSLDGGSDNHGLSVEGGFRMAW